MRVIASVQSKKGSSRGLVHYIAHSKIDSAHEPEKGRELFNAYTDHLTVQSANNFLKADCGKGRPSNNELHHLVLSFRQEDFLRLGATDEARQKRIKLVTRSAVGKLEKWLHTDRLAWAGAVHLNTANPHVHIAVQKQYQRTDLNARTLTKIPREALPHFQLAEGEKRIVDGFLIEAAKLELDNLISGHNRSRQHKANRKTARTNASQNREAPIPSDDSDRERQILRRGILAEYELKYRKDRISFLIERRDDFRYPITDPTTGAKYKLSLKNLESRSKELEGSQTEAKSRQIRAISNSILAREESAFFNLEADTVSVRNGARQIRRRCKKSGTKMPLPAFSKSDLDQLQNQCLASARPRDYLFLEKIRIDLEASKEISPRDNNDLEILTGQKLISEVRVKFFRKQLSDFQDNSYYRKIPIGKERFSLAMLERDSDHKSKPDGSLLRSLRLAVQAITGRKRFRVSQSGKLRLVDSVNRELNRERLRLENGLRSEQKSFEIISNVLERYGGEGRTSPALSTEQLLELEATSRKLRIGSEFSATWKLQKNAIRAAGSHSKVDKGSQSVNGGASRLITGRVVASDTLCQIGLNQSKEDLALFQKSKRHHKFAIHDEKSGINYLSLNDVDLPRKNSVLDHALDLIFESKDHRTLRHELEARVNAREASLKADLSAAKELALAASREASNLKEGTMGDRPVSLECRPLFSTSEIGEIEKRIERTVNRKEAARLRTILERSLTVSLASFNEVINREIAPTPNRDQPGPEISGRSVDQASQSEPMDRRTRGKHDVGMHR